MAHGRTCCIRRASLLLPVVNQLSVLSWRRFDKHVYVLGVVVFRKLGLGRGRFYSTILLDGELAHYTLIHLCVSFLTYRGFIDIESELVI